MTEQPPTASAGAGGAHPPATQVPGTPDAAPSGPPASTQAAEPAAIDVAALERDRAQDEPQADADDPLPVRVHAGRLDRQVGPLALSPAEALHLAAHGRRGLVRRSLPPTADGRTEG